MLTRVLIALVTLVSVLALVNCAGAVPGWGRTSIDLPGAPDNGNGGNPPAPSGNDNGGGGSPPTPPGGGGSPPPPPSGGGTPPPPPPPGAEPTYANDTLYAYPLQAHAAVGEPVTVQVATGLPAHSLQFLSSVAVSVDDAGAYIANSFNLGAPGGARLDADGMWGAMGVPNGQFLDLGDGLMPGAGDDMGRGRHVYTFAVVTMGPYPATNSEGVLFNFQLSFSQPGTYHIGLRPTDGRFDLTYYSDGEGVNYFWGATLADADGAQNPDVTGFSNEIVVE
jgi:hypothetical protein